MGGLGNAAGAHRTLYHWTGHPPPPTAPSPSPSVQRPPSYRGGITLFSLRVGEVQREV